MKWSALIGDEGGTKQKERGDGVSLRDKVQGQKSSGVRSQGQGEQRTSLPDAGLVSCEAVFWE